MNFDIPLDLGQQIEKSSNSDPHHDLQPIKYLNSDNEFVSNNHAIDSEQHILKLMLERDCNMRTAPSVSPSKSSSPS